MTMMLVAVKVPEFCIPELPIYLSVCFCNKIYLDISFSATRFHRAVKEEFVEAVLQDCQHLFSEDWEVSIY